VCKADKAAGVEWSMTAVNSVAASQCPQSYSGAMRETTHRVACLRNDVIALSTTGAVKLHEMKFLV